MNNFIENGRHEDFEECLNLIKEIVNKLRSSGLRPTKQRVLIAKSLVLKPRIIIADEPTTSLDVTTQKGILDLLKNLVHQNGLSLLLITHDLAVLAQSADRVAIMKSGEILEIGDLKTVFKTKKNYYTRKLLDSVNYSPIKKNTASKKILLGTPMSKLVTPFFDLILSYFSKFS